MSHLVAVLHSLAPGTVVSFNRYLLAVERRANLFVMSRITNTC